MRRLLASLTLLAVLAPASYSADTPKVAPKDTPAAAITREKRLTAKVTLDVTNELLRDVMSDLTKQVNEAVEGGKFQIKFGTGVNMNTKITFKGEGTLAEVMDKFFKAKELGYYVVSKKGDKTDGFLMVTKGDERGYPMPTVKPKK